MDKLYCKDLMIDDWVYVPRLKKQVRVGAVYKTMIVPNPLDDNIHVSIGEEYIEPIPLTSEILEKNGWESLRNGSGDFVLTVMENGQKRYDYDATITYNNFNFVMNKKFYKGLPVVYVHQLQHALKLCGIKKEIVL